MALSAKKARAILDKYADKVEEARSIHYLFTKKDRDEVYFTQINWPEDQVILGRAQAIGYTSDKWNEDDSFVDYIHWHEIMNPYVLVGRPSVPRNKIERELSKQPSSDVQIPGSNPMIVPFLAYALDLQFVRDGKVLSVDWKQEKHLPVLCRHLENEHVLIVVSQDGGSPVIIWSPYLRVTERGIEY